jgi:branched-chain amino acid transport system permease protein
MDTFIQQLINGLMQGGIYALLALALTLVYGLLGVLNFAEGQFVTLGAYVAYALTASGAPLLAGLAAAMIATYAVGAVCEVALFRRVQNEPIKGLLVSIGLIALGEAFFLKVWGPDSHRLPSFFSGRAWRVSDVAVVPDRAVILILAVVVFSALAWFLSHGKWGRALRACAQNRDAALLMGIPVGWVTNVSFAGGAALGGTLGVLIGAVFFVDPFIGDVPLLKGFIVLILGGAGSPAGALVGGLLLGVVEALGAGYVSSNFQDGIAFVVLIVVLLVRPRGLFSGELVERA